MLRSLLNGALRSGAISSRRGGGYGGARAGYGGGGYGGGRSAGLGAAMGLASRFMRRR